MHHFMPPEETVFLMAMVFVLLVMASAWCLLRLVASASERVRAWWGRRMVAKTLARAANYRFR